MFNDSHDEVASEAGAPREGGDEPHRRFADPDGRVWEVSWRRSETGGPSYLFRAVDGGAEHHVAAGSRSGDRLAAMNLADVRQLLAIARADSADA
jgi:hypothetical protein